MKNPFAPENLFSLKGRTALVTGSSRGIGAAIAQGYAAAGATVFVHGQSPASTENALKNIIVAGGRAEAISGDLGMAGEGRRLIEECVDRAGQLDILCINASAQINATLNDLTPEDLALQIDVNLRSTIDMLQTCLPLMAKRGWGRVINIGSVNQQSPKAIVTAYAATKAAQHNIVQSQAREYAGKGVILNTLAPGLIDTDRNADHKTSDPEGWNAYTREINWMRRAGQPEELVGLAIFLASDACSFVTGETVMATGGM